MRQAELRAAAQCGRCSRKFGEAGLPMFWRLTIERHGVMLDAMERARALEVLVGSPAIAAVMGPDEELTATLLPPVTITVCEKCAVEPTCVAELGEAASRLREAKDHEAMLRATARVETSLAGAMPEVRELLVERLDQLTGPERCPDCGGDIGNPSPTDPRGGHKYGCGV